MKKINFQLRTTAVFKCIITFVDGTRKILRMTIDRVANFTYLFRSQQSHIFKDESYLFYMGCREFIAMSTVASARFINERTGEELLAL